MTPVAIDDYQRRPVTPEQQLLQMGTVQFPAPAPAVQRPGLLGEFIRANKAGLGSVVSGIGQTAADVLPGVGQGNSLIQAGNELSDANQSSIQSFGDIVRNPLTAASTAAGFATSSIAARFAARAAGRAVLAATPALTGVNPILGAVAAGTGAALYTLGPWAVSAAQGVGAIARRQFEKDPENAASPGATAARLVGGGLTGALEGFGAERFIPGAGGVLAGAIRPGGLASRVAQGTARAGLEEAVEEVPQSIVEQVASFDNPLSAKSLQETAFQATMGAMGGGVVGGTMAGAFGPRPAQPTIPPQNIPTEDLGRSVDEILAPQQLDLPLSQAPSRPAAQRQLELPYFEAPGEPPPPAPPPPPGAPPDTSRQLDLPLPGTQQDLSLPAVPPPGTPPSGTQLDLPFPGEQFSLPLPEPQQPEAASAPAPFAALPVAAIPKGLPSAYKTAFEQAATPEDLATRIRKVFYDKAVVGQSAARYVLGEGQSNLMSMYQAVTGQEMPSSEALAQEFEGGPKGQLDLPLPEPPPVPPRTYRPPAAIAGEQLGLPGIEAVPVDLAPPAALQPPAVPAAPEAALPSQAPQVAPAQAAPQGAPVVQPPVAPQVEPVVQPPVAPAPQQPAQQAPSAVPKLTLTKAKRMLALPADQLAPESRAYVEQYVRETEQALSEARAVSRYDSKPGEFSPAEKALRQKGKKAPFPGSVQTIDGVKHIPMADAVAAAQQMVADGVQGDLATNINERLGLTRPDAKRVASEVRKTTPQASQTTAPGAQGVAVPTVIRELVTKLGRAAYTKLRKVMTVVPDIAAMQEDMQRRGSTFSGLLRSYVGRAAAQRDAELERRLNIAQEMEERGDDKDKIRLVTGWFRNPYDQKWRYEVSDARAALLKAWPPVKSAEPGSDRLVESPIIGVQTTYRLEDVLDHPRLYELYPQTRGIQFVVHRAIAGVMDDVQGWFELGRDRDRIVVTPVAADPLSTLLHEVQHWVQAKEGFAFGGSPDTVVSLLTPEQKQRVRKSALRTAMEEAHELALAAARAYIADGAPAFAAYKQAHDTARAAEAEYVAAGRPEGDLKAAWLRATRVRTDAYIALRAWAKTKGIEGNTLSRFIASAVNGANIIEDAEAALAEANERVELLQAGDDAALVQVLEKSGETYKLYLAIAGEIESRDVQARQNLDEVDRLLTPPYSSENIPSEDVIVHFGDGSTRSVQLSQVFAGEVNNITGLYDPSTDHTYIVAGNLPSADSTWGVFLHEVGAHYGLEKMLGTRAHNYVLSEISRLVRANEPALLAVARQVNTVEGLGLDPAAADFAEQFAAQAEANPQIAREAVAYLAQDPANHTRPLWKRIVAAVKEFLRKFGWAKSLNADEITAMVVAAARKAGDMPQRPAAAPDSVARDAMAALQQYGYSAQQQAGVWEILDPNGQVVSEADIPDTLQLAAAIIKYPAIRAGLDQDVAAHGPLFSRTTAAASALPETPRTAYEAVGDFANIARGLLAKLVGQPANSMSTNVLKAAVGWMDKRHFVEMYDTTFKEGIKQNAAADDLQEAATSRINQMFNSPYHKIQEMQRSDRAAFDIINELMMSTEQHIDPRKTWEQQEHLHELEGRQLDQVREQVKLARQKYGRLSPTAKVVYEDLVNMNETLYLMDMAISLQNLVHAQIPETAIPPVFRTNAMSEFNRRAEAHKDIQAAKKYWADVLDSYVAATDKHIDDLRGKLPQGEPETPEFKASVRAALKGVTDPKLRKRIQAMLRSARRTSTDKAQAATVKHLMPLEAQLVGIQKGLTAIGQAPYFHMGRFGDFFVAFKVKADGEGQADPRAMQAVYAALHARFPDIVLRSDGLDPNVFARFESSAQAEQFKKAVQELQRQGHIPPVGTLTKDGKTDLGTIFAGPREGAFGEPQRVGPEMLHRILESIQDDDYEPGVAARLRADMQALYLDSLPDTSAVKFLQRRKGRQGFAADMLRSYAHRMYSGSSRVAGLSVQPLREQSFRTMNSVLQDNLANPNMSEDDKSKQKIIVEELRRRERERTQQPHTPILSMLRSVNHAFFLALSPAFVATQVAQVGILAWPELAKRHGFAKAAKAITKVTPEAAKILIAAIREGYKTRGWHGATDMVLTDDILKAANLSPGVEAFIVEMMATGKLDIGNATRELARVAEGEVSGEKTTKAAELLKMATATSYGSELFTRTIVALAAKELHQGSGAVEYAANVIDNAMLNYNITNIARLTGKKGVIGPYTPVALSFKQYPLQLLTKLYREIYRAIGEREGVTETQAKEARTFLKAHATAMVATSGVLGLPFATAVAALVDHLCELFSDVPCDTKTSIRNFTADVVGHDLEPLVTRGLPRILGADVSNRLTEADVIPFSRFMADRREMSEKLKLLAWGSYGAPASMIGNVITGLETAMSGDILGGAQKALPSFLRGPANAISAASRGFTDNQQNQLPITPHTADILWQMLGIAPGRLTDYNEARFAQTQRTGLLDREAAKIRRNLVVAIEQQDRAAMLKYARQAQEYQQNNPGRSILPNIGSAVQQRQRARAIAGATGLPIGANPRDLGARSFTSYYRPEAVQ